MSLLAKALLVVTMHQLNGNATIGSESVSVLSNMDECRGAMTAFIRTKGNVQTVVNQTDSMSFEQVQPGWLPNTFYKLVCKEL
ncbi:hypothetical protein D3C75_772010 [compost metagenome]